MESAWKKGAEEQDGLRKRWEMRETLNTHGCLFNHVCRGDISLSSHDNCRATHLLNWMRCIAEYCFGLHEVIGIISRGPHVEFFRA